MKDVFKFRIGGRIFRADGKYEVMVSVSMTAPHVIFPMRLANSNDDVLRMELAKAETKMAMIKALMDGEWEFEK